MPGPKVVAAVTGVGIIAGGTPILVGGGGGGGVPGGGGGTPITPPHGGGGGGVPVPEPSTIAIFAIGLVALFLARHFGGRALAIEAGKR